MFYSHLKNIIVIIKKAVPKGLLWYKESKKNRVIVWEITAILIIIVSGMLLYSHTRLHEDDVAANNVPDIYVSPTRYSLSSSRGNIHIYELESRIINRSSVAINTTYHVVMALTNDSIGIEELYGEDIFIYPSTLSNDIIFADAEVGYQLAYCLSEMDTGGVALDSGDFPGIMLTCSGDILYSQDTDAYDPTTESSVFYKDELPHIDRVEYKLVTNCSSDEELNTLMDQLFISVEASGSYNANAGEIYVVSDEQNISEQTIFSHHK